MGLNEGCVRGMKLDMFDKSSPLSDRKNAKILQFLKSNSMNNP